jgi:anaerobic selenocysteine-containing dehydrogenase
MDVRTSLCRNCAALCPVVVTLDEGRVVRVEGDREAPLYGGYTCPKGRAMGQQHERAGRLLHSLKRLPDGRRVPISSEQLVEEITERLARIRDAHGPMAVAAYLGGAVQEQQAAASLMVSFLRAIGSPMMFAASTIDQPGQHMALALHGRWEGGRPRPNACEAFLVVGGNPVVSKQHFPQNPAQQLKALTGRGMKLIVIDPRRTETARRAAVHLQLIPGEDPTVLAGLANLIFALGGVDHVFLAQNAESADALRQAVAGFTPEYVSARAGVRQADLMAAARILVEARMGDTALGVGPSMATRGTLSAYLALCINTLRGFWPRAGDAVSRPRVLLPPLPHRAQPAPPRPAWGFGLQTSVRGLQQTAAGMPTAALPELMLSDAPARIRALFLHAGPMYTWPQQSRTIEALSRLDLLVTHDVELSATAELAHYVIATKSQLEVPVMSQLAEVCGVVHPGYAWTEPYGAYQPAAIEPPDGSDLLESWQIYFRIAQRLGLTLEVVDFMGGGGGVPPKVDMGREPTTDEIYELMCAGSAVPLSRVKQYPHGAVFEDARAVIGPRDPACTARLQLGDPAMHAELRAIRAENVGGRRKTGPDFPFLLIPRRMQTMNNSGFRVESPMRPGYNPAFMHPDDLARLSLDAGARVEIRSRHGAIIGFVEPDPDLRRGVVAMSHGYGARPGVAYDPRRHGANVNELLSWQDDCDPYHGMPRMGAVPIAVAPLADTEPQQEAAGGGLGRSHVDAAAGAA